MSSLIVWCPISVSIKLCTCKSYQGIGLREVEKFVFCLRFLNMWILILPGLGEIVRLVAGLRFHH